MTQRKHSPDSKYVRELLQIGTTEARQRTGLSASYVSRIAAGKVTSLSDSAYNKFHNAYRREQYAICREHNVSAHGFRSVKKGGLDLSALDFAASLTDFGRTFEHAVNDIRNWQKDIDRGVELPEILDRVVDLEDKYMDMTKILVVNNGLLKQWQQEGRRFMNKPGTIRTMQDAMDHMAEIMALGFRNEKGWDLYIKERTRVEKWQPSQFIVDKKAKKTRRELIEDRANPKYIEWQRRTRAGKIVSYNPS